MRLEVGRCLIEAVRGWIGVDVLGIVLWMDSAELDFVRSSFSSFSAPSKN